MTDVGSVYMVVLSNDPAPSEGHTQAMELAQYVAEETDLRLRGQFLTLDEEKFNRMRQEASDEWPKPDFESDTDE
jgi:hypothetical protein